MATNEVPMGHHRRVTVVVEDRVTGHVDTYLMHKTEELILNANPIYDKEPRLAGPIPDVIGVLLTFQMKVVQSDDESEMYRLTQHDPEAGGDPFTLAHEHVEAHLRTLEEYAGMEEAGVEVDWADTPAADRYDGCQTCQIRETLYAGLTYLAEHGVDIRGVLPIRSLTT